MEGQVSSASFLVDDRARRPQRIRGSIVPKSASGAFSRIRHAPSKYRSRGPFPDRPHPIEVSSLTEATIAAEVPAKKQLA